MFKQSSSFRRAIGLARGGTVVTVDDLEVCFEEIFSLLSSPSFTDP